MKMNYCSSAILLIKLLYIIVSSVSGELSALAKNYAHQPMPSSCNNQKIAFSDCSSKPSHTSSLSSLNNDNTITSEEISRHTNDEQKQPESNNYYCQTKMAKSVDSPQVINTYDFNCEQLNFCDDRLGFEAILYLHRQLDEDANGDIDITESDEFIRDELKYENGAERQKAFHGNDKHITVDELWNAWCISTVHNWSVDQTIEWLEEVVELPNYRDKFLAHGINGIALPRLAANSQMFALLGINNPIHKQKITLKAMDVVLFGIPKPRSSTKDFIMVFLLLFAIAVVSYAYYQQKYSKEHIRKMTKEIEALANAEKQLEQLQMELDKTKQEHEEAFKEKRDLERKLKKNEQQTSSMDGCSVISSDLDRADGDRIKKLEDELYLTKCELMRYDKLSSASIPSKSLQPYLQFTYELENKHYNSKKSAAELQLKSARDGCDKLKRKRSSILGAFRVVHNSNINYVDNTIIQARQLLAELTAEMQERIRRWKYIEQLCGFEIIHNPGFMVLEQHLYGSNSLKTSSSTASFAKIFSRRTSDVTIADDDNLSITAPSYHIANQAIQAWHRSATNYVKKPSHSHVNSNATMEENYSDSGFYIGDDQSINGSNINQLSNNKKCKSLVGHKSNWLSSTRNTNSDGVEKHFDERQQQNCKKISQSETNINDRTFMDAIYLNNNSNTVMNNNSRIRQSNESIELINDCLNDGCNEDGTVTTTSSSSSNEEISTATFNDSTLTLATCKDLNKNNKSNKRDYFRSLLTNRKLQ